MLRKITTSFANFFIQPKEAATALPVIVDPKVPNKPQTQPSASTRTKTSSGDIKLTATDRRTANLDLLTLRNWVTTKATIRDLAQVCCQNSRCRPLPLHQIPIRLGIVLWLTVFALRCHT